MIGSQEQIIFGANPLSECVEQVSPFAHDFVLYVNLHVCCFKTRVLSKLPAHILEQLDEEKKQEQVSPDSEIEDEKKKKKKSKVKVKSKGFLLKALILTHIPPIQN